MLVAARRSDLRHRPAQPDRDRSGERASIDRRASLLFPRRACSCSPPPPRHGCACCATPGSIPRCRSVASPRTISTTWHRPRSPACWPSARRRTVADRLRGHRQVREGGGGGLRLRLRPRRPAARQAGGRRRTPSSAGSRCAAGWAGCTPVTTSSTWTVARRWVRWRRPSSDSGHRTTRRSRPTSRLASRSRSPVPSRWTAGRQPFIDGIEGDPSNVIGLSMPLLRRLLAQLSVRITDLWC